MNGLSEAGRRANMQYFDALALKHASLMWSAQVRSKNWADYVSEVRTVETQGAKYA